MKANRSGSIEDYKIVSSFQNLRKTLLEEKFADRLERPLAYWAMPNDRRLPLAFLGRTIKDLLATPFEELSATPGIGQKKISSLVKLLSRATKDHPPAEPFGISDLADGKRTPIVEKPQRNQVAFDPSIVSEALWTQWRETVARHGLGKEKLGRIARTLQALPTVIWHTPLETYLNHTVSEIRQLKTHGEKRVRVILEAFYTVHEVFSSLTPESHLTLRLLPQFIASVENWIAQAMDQPGAPTPDEVARHLAIPLLEQINIDAGPTIYGLSRARLGINGPGQSVRQQAKQMGVTRARIYQLLEECSKVMHVRWPEGESLLHRLIDKAKAHATDAVDLRLLTATAELFFPGKTSLSDEDESANGDALALNGSAGNSPFGPR